MKRFMRILVLFDLPTTTDHNKREYVQFRTYLLKQGYTMVQYSVYSRICPNPDSVSTHIKRLKRAAPSDGSVRVLVLTNKQFSDAVIVTGAKKPQEKHVTDHQMVLF